MTQGYTGYTSMCTYHQELKGHPQDHGINGRARRSGTLVATHAFFHVRRDSDGTDILANLYQHHSPLLCGESNIANWSDTALAQAYEK